MHARLNANEALTRFDHFSRQIRRTSTSVPARRNQSRALQQKVGKRTR